MAALPLRSRLAELTAPDAFWWSAGIEDTFITAPHPTTGRTLDEYELTGHYDRWPEDLALMASLGVSCARYGVPWHRIQPAPGRWEWHHADAPLERLLALGIAPQVDLVHYGLPGWIEGAYLNPDYPALVAEFAARLATRFRGRIHWYTPMNEPRIAAWYCGRLGWWPPFRHSWRGFAEVLLAAARGIQATTDALRQVDPEIVAYHVDASDLYAAAPALEAVAAHRRALVLLPHDLVAGRVDAGHPLHAWLRGLGIPEAALDALVQNAAPPDVLGLNLYPLFTHKRIGHDAAGHVRIRMPYTEDNLVEDVARGFHRHCGLPMMISETATSGPPARRMRWLRRSMAGVRTLRAEGVPLVGYTWWPMFALVTWAWRQGRRDVAQHLLQMGLWDLDPTLERIPTPVVDAYRALVAAGAAPAGVLAAGAT